MVASAPVELATERITSFQDKRWSMSYTMTLGTPGIAEIRYRRYRASEAPAPVDHSTVTLLARLRGLSTSVPRAQAVWYASSCSGTTCSSGLSAP
ncbi:hypothetical protein DFQ15_11159 [Xylophilus ampelinus]|uniref:Uncharacterized protein n=1 Tax=Xylophilus ampelinus TaxID=54067 RepID=A0A318SH20_9BURK|nr:hypothetical protein DFQ15_11159 [Xylophilus ampelinus]